MSQKYSEIRETLRTGDIVLFSGKGGISAGIKWATLSRWSHVGMILKLVEYDFVTVWESTTLSDVADLESKMPRKGVQLVPLSARINRYDGDIAVRRLQGVEIGADDIRKLMQLRPGLLEGAGGLVAFGSQTGDLFTLVAIVVAALLGFMFPLIVIMITGQHSNLV